MTHIIFIMGATCAGKSTMILYAKEQYPFDFAAIEVGKIFREKYPPGYFKGQDSPEHTKKEASDLLVGLVDQEIMRRVPFVIVDGQPRDIDQVELCLKQWPGIPKHFVLLHASLKERERRARLYRSGDDLEQLAIPRLTNDMISCYSVMVELMRHGIAPYLIDTENGMREIEKFIDTASSGKVMKNGD